MPITKQTARCSTGDMAPKRQRDLIDDDANEFKFSPSTMSCMLLDLCNTPQDLSERVKEFLELYFKPSSFNRINDIPLIRSHNALHCAAFRGHVETVRVLLRHPDICVNTKSKYGGRNALALACRGGSHEVIDLLLRDGRSDINNELEPVMWWPVMLGDIKTVRRLAADGRYINLGEKRNGTCVLNLAIKKKKFKCAYIINKLRNKQRKAVLENKK